MIDHLSLQVQDVDASSRFYTTVFAAIGVRELLRYDDAHGTVAGLCGPDGDPQLWFGPMRSAAFPGKCQVIRDTERVTGPRCEQAQPW